jgi:pyruvate dehydrogenase E1 component beta subunit
MKLSVRSALNQALDKCLLDNPNVFIIGEEVAKYNGAYKITQGLLDKYGPTRVVDSPISEYGFAGLAVGAAFKGLIPIVEFMSFNFSMQAIDHVINSAAKTPYMSGGRIKCGVVFRGPNGMARGVAAQHSQNYSSWYANCPGIVVINPYNAFDFYGLMLSAVKSKRTVVFLEHELLYGKEFEGDSLKEVEIGKAHLERVGKDITFVSFSNGMNYAIEAANILQKDYNIEAEVIDLRTIRPLDVDCICASIMKTSRIICIEEGWGFCGIASEIITLVNEKCFDFLDAQPARVTGEDVPMPYSSGLEKLASPTVDKIIHKALDLCNKR